MQRIKYLLQSLVLIIFCNNVFAQVPVIKEPHHKPVLVNDYVRLLDVHINPGDTTLYHIHAAPSVIVMISNSIIGSQKHGEAASTPNEVLPGQVSYIDYGTNPITHRVYNAGKNVFHVMDIELAKKNPSTDSCNAFQQNNVETKINEKLVRVYKFDLTANNSLHINKGNCAHLLICILGEVNAGNKKLTSGNYFFFNPNTELSVSNNQTGNATCVLLELK